YPQFLRLGLIIVTTLISQSHFIPTYINMAIIKNTYLSMLSGCNRTQTRGAQFCAVVAYYFEALATIFTGMKLFSAHVDPLFCHFWRSSCNYTQHFFTVEFSAD